MPGLISRKQQEFLLDPLHRINLLQGSVRSGKTWVSLVKWAMFVRQRPTTELFMMVGKTRETLHINCITLLAELAGENFVCTSQTAKTAWLYGHQIRLLGASDDSAVSRIKGSTLAGAYIDELTEIPESFYKMTLSRLSVDGAALFATTNPDSPNNYVYRTIVTNDDIDAKCYKFLLTDNDFLPESYVENITKEYTGVFYRRFILGEWCIAEGLVYEFGEENITDDSPNDGEWYISIDYGTMNPFSAGLWCVKDDKAVRVDEYYYSGRSTGKQRTDEDYCDDVKKLAGDREIVQVVVDPSAASFIESLKRKGFRVKKADNSVLDGIRRTATYLRDGNIKINRKCEHAIAEFGLYSWNDKANQDEVVKENDHAMDEIRYFCNTIMRRKVRRESWTASF